MSPAERLAQHRRINQRPVPCPRCGETVQAGNLARHRRRMCRFFGSRWGVR